MSSFLDNLIYNTRDIVGGTWSGINKYTYIYFIKGII